MKGALGDAVASRWVLGLGQPDCFWDIVTKTGGQVSSRWGHPGLKAGGEPGFSSPGSRYGEPGWELGGSEHPLCLSGASLFQRESSFP